MIGTILFLVELILVAYVKFYAPLSDAKIHSGTGTLAVVVVLLAVSAPLLIIFSYSISKKKMWMHEQRLAGARNILATIPRDMSLGGSNNNLSYSSLTNNRSHFYSRDSRSVDIADETIV